MRHEMVWEPGEQILQQELWWGSLLTARPVTVVEDRPDQLALYTHLGARYQSASVFRGNRYDLPVEERARLIMGDLEQFEERVSSNHHVLNLIVPGSWHSVRLHWTSEWELEFWYVNLQAPIQRTNHGILDQDYILDILIKPDMSWSLKDADEFSELHRRGFFTDEQFLFVHAEADRMINTTQSKAMFRPSLMVGQVGSPIPNGPFRNFQTNGTFWELLCERVAENHRIGSMPAHVLLKAQRLDRPQRLGAAKGERGRPSGFLPSQE